MPKEVTFAHGVMCEEYETQANKQGYTLGKEKESIEKVRKAIFMLRFNDMLTDTQYNQLLKKLHKKIVKALKPLKKDGVENETIKN